MKAAGLHRLGVRLGVVDFRLGADLLCLLPNQRNELDFNK